MLLGKWQFRTVSEGIWCLEWPFSPSCFSQAVVWKFCFSSCLVCSLDLLQVHFDWAHVCFLDFVAQSYGQLGNCTNLWHFWQCTRYQGFSRVRRPSHERQKTHAGHYLSLTKTAKRAIKVSRIQGMPRQASTFFLRATVFFNSQCNNIWLLDKLKRSMFSVRIRTPVPVLLQPCSRGSRLFQEKERQKSPGSPAGRGPVPPKSLLAGRACRLEE